MAEIYGLYSGRDGKVRYVGQTLGSGARRFEQHKHIAVGRFITAVYTWIHREWRHGYPVECALLQTCGDEVRSQLETEWMRKFPNLLNDRKYWFRGGNPPVIPEIKNYMRSHVFNCGGFRGIHWWRQIDRYAVLTNRGEWLLGDEAPGWGGNIFFSDRTEALKVRDRYRHYQKHTNWLPDVEAEVDL